MNHTVGFEEGAVKNFVARAHANVVQPGLLHPATVAVAAKRLVFQTFGGGDADTSADVVYWGGWLLYAISHYGSSFDHLCELADYPVAKLVSAITPDMRMPRAKRVVYYRSQITSETPLVQLLKFSEITLWLEFWEQQQALDGLRLQSRPEHVTDTGREFRELVPALHHLQEHEWSEGLFKQLEQRFLRLESAPKVRRACTSGLT